MTRQLDSLLALAEQAVTVADLLGGQELWCVDPDESAVDAAKELRRLNFDAAPLREEPITRCIVAAKTEGHLGTVSEAAQPITADLLVSSSLPLADAVIELGARPFLFVLGRRGITHVLTAADLQLPPVSLVVFGLIAAAEAALDRLIEDRFGDAWGKRLTDKGLARVDAVFAERQRNNTEVSRLQCLNLDDRLAIAVREPAIWRATGSSSREQFKKMAEVLKKLRNVLAHGGGLLDAESDSGRAVELFAMTRRLATATWASVEQQEELFDAFALTSIQLLNRDGVLAGDDAMAELPLPPPLHVITAWNPGGQPHSTEENSVAGTRLTRRLRHAGTTFLPAEGWAGTWSEESVVTSGMSRPAATALGVEFGQAAIFELTDDDVLVVDCISGRVRRGRPRRSPTAATVARDPG